MSEEKTIDGVNVAECIYFSEEGHYCDFGGECDGCNTCYYRKLKQVEKINSRIAQKYAKLEQEYKQLEKEHKKLIAQFNAISLSFREANEKINELETILKMIG